MHRLARRLALLLLGAALTAPGSSAQTEDDPPLSAYDDIRGRFNAPDSTKITEGIIVQRGQYSAVAGISKGHTPLPGCTGTLIATDMVLTAAHCVCGLAIGRTGHADANVMFGDSPDDPKRRYFAAVGFYSDTTCGTYDDDIRPSHDFGLLQIKPLASPKPISLATGALIDKAKTFLVVGYGAVDHDGNTVDFKKRYAEIPSVSPSCSGAREGRPDRAVYECVVGAEIVAGQRRSPDTCRGDSGGPLLVAIADGVQLAGITSRSIPNVPTVCGNGGVYERVTAAMTANIIRQEFALRARARE